MRRPRLSTDRYCPTCRRRRPHHAQLCPECGDRTSTRGYCSVCEQSLDAPPGTPCPKHDILLDDTPPPFDTPLPGTPRHPWVTVLQYPYSSLAHAPRILLESEGIPTFLDGERVADEAAYSLATGGVRLQVPADEFARALSLLGLPPRELPASPSSHSPARPLLWFLFLSAGLGATLLMRCAADL